MYKNRKPMIQRNSEKCMVHYDVIRTQEGSKVWLYALTIFKAHRHQGIFRKVFKELFKAWGPVEFECNRNLCKIYEHIGCVKIKDPKGAPCVYRYVDNPLNP